MKHCLLRSAWLAVALAPAALRAQTSPTVAPSEAVPDSTRAAPWSVHFQQTAVQQWHAGFRAPYTGTFSLQPRESAKLSLTSTAYIGRRLWRGAAVFLNPELAGGSGLSGARGVAGFPNGETFRVGDPAPTLYLARLYLRQVWALGPGTEATPDDPNQLAGPAPTHYLAFTAGKFSIADFFDQNTYSHDPRTQFLNWSLMSAGAWDYPANVRGYTVGAVLEYVTPRWSLRAATTAVPTEANGARLDRRYGQARSNTVELTRTHTLRGLPGTVRLLGFRTVAGMGSYRRAAQLPTPDVTAARQPNRTKTGVVLNAEQQLSGALGAFARVSYNDGRNETWAFTEIDQSASLGLVHHGAPWHRPTDEAGAAVVVNGISRPHRAYLAAGGYGFIIGDGALRYAPEYITEWYYSLALPRYHAALTPNYQFILHPAYNQDRGPVHVAGLRVHVSF